MTWTRYHLATFLLTYCIYTTFHASRKAYSDVKNLLSEEWTALECNSSWPCPTNGRIWDGSRLFPDGDSAELFLGTLDTVFLFCYSVGMYFTSAAADRFELRKALSIGMCISAILLFIFGVLTEWLYFYHKAFYAVLWALQGIVQSVGWPACVAVLGHWFGKSGRGIVFGLWSSCASVGNIIGNVVASGVVFYGYEYAFLAISSMMLGGGIVIFFGLVNAPEDVGLPKPNESECETDALNQEGLQPSSNVNMPTGTENLCGNAVDCKDVTADDPEKAISFLDALLLPGVALYSLSFACLKLVNYAFLFWLPYYLTNNFHWDEAKSSSISTWYDVGGILGGIACGILSDRLKNRSPVLFVMLMISPFTLWGYKSSPDNVVINSVLMAITGFFINGVANILSSAIAIDLARQVQVGKNGKALATVTGIIDGTGSMGAAIGQYLVAVIETKYGWGWVFNFFIIANFAALLFMLPLFYCDLKQYSCYHYLVEKFCIWRNYSPLEGKDGDEVGPEQ